MLIDIEARNNPRYASPQISFRRTEADRKPAKVFARPNDYALTIEEREAASARRLEYLNAKRIEAQRIWTERMGVAQVEEIEKVEEKARELKRLQDVQLTHVGRRKIAIMLALNSGAETTTDIANRGICTVRVAHKFLTSLREEGLVNSVKAEKAGPMGGFLRVTWRLSNAGCEFVAGNK